MAERFLNICQFPLSLPVLSSVTNAKTGQLPSFKWLDLIAVFPTSYVAFKEYKNLIATVVFGVVLVALAALSSWILGL